MRYPDKFLDRACVSIFYHIQAGSMPLPNLFSWCRRRHLELFLLSTIIKIS